MTVPAASPALFPPFVGQCSLALDPDALDEAERRLADVDRQGALRRAPGAPRVEYLAGRFCAREAMRACAPEHAGRPIPTGPHREPVWPAGIVGSITHTRRFASAVVARRAHARGIGLDVETVVGDEVVARLAPTVAVPDEIREGCRATRWEPGAAFTLLFSAKEALFKCLFPQVGRRFDFLDARIDEVDVARRTFRARLLTALSPSFPAGHTLVGRFERGDAHVASALLLPP